MWIMKLVNHKGRKQKEQKQIAILSIFHFSIYTLMSTISPFDTSSRFTVAMLPRG